MEEELKFLKKEQMRALEKGAKDGQASRQAILYTKRVAEQMEAVFSVKLSLFELVASLEMREHRLLVALRYLNGLTWEEIAEALEVDVRHVYRLHNQALSCICQPILEEIGERAGG